MEESVWAYFGIIAVIVMLGIIVTLFSTYKEDSSRESLFQGVEQLAIHADQVCDSPRDTMLSIDIPVPGGSSLYALGDRICAQTEEDVKCVATECVLEERTILNLTSDAVRRLGSREYHCTVRNNGTLDIICQG